MYLNQLIVRGKKRHCHYLGPCPHFSEFQRNKLFSLCVWSHSLKNSVCLCVRVSNWEAFFVCLLVWTLNPSGSVACRV